MIPTGEQFKETVSLIFKNEGYTSAFNFIYHKGYDAKEVQEYLFSLFKIEEKNNVTIDNMFGVPVFFGMDPAGATNEKTVTVRSDLFEGFEMPIHVKPPNKPSLFNRFFGKG